MEKITKTPADWTTQNTYPWKSAPNNISQRKTTKKTFRFFANCKYYNKITPPLCIYNQFAKWRTRNILTNNKKTFLNTTRTNKKIELWKIQITNCKCDSHISTEVALNLRNLVDGFEANRWFSVDLSKKKENGRHCSFCWRLVEHFDFHGPLTYWSINQNSAEENRNFGKNNQLGKKQSQDKKGGRILFGRLRRHGAMIIWLMVPAWSVVSVSDIQNYALIEGTTKYSKYYLGQVCA